MNCYFCKRDLDLYIKDYCSAFRCIDCNYIYVSADKFRTFLDNYMAMHKISEEDRLEILFKIDASNIIDKLIPKSFAKCKLCNSCNRNNCDIYAYTFGEFKFWYCNYKDYYCFYESDLTKAIKKQIFNIKVNKIFRKIKTKFISLFIEGTDNGKK